MKCKCNNEMEEICSYEREGRGSDCSVNTRIVYWCRKCGTLSKVDDREVPLPDWYEPKSIKKRKKRKSCYGCCKAAYRDNRKMARQGLYSICTWCSRNKEHYRIHDEYRKHD